MSLLSRLLRRFSPRARAPREVCGQNGDGRAIRARFDAADDLNETRVLWARADALDADAANSLAVRKKLRNRSRYERSNNGYADGIVDTQANYVIGRGPKVRVETASPGFNAMVEAAWKRWCQAVKFSRKLRTLCKAKTGDGEGVALLFNNPLLGDRVQLDLRPIETDRVTAPVGSGAEDGYVDGVRFDQYGNLLAYDVLRRHPGAAWSGFAQQEYDVWPARFVLHWFGADRADQHRGVPDTTPSLNLGATSRRYREAVLAAAETAADFSAVLEMPAGEDGPDAARPFSAMPIEKRMFVATPAGAKLAPMRAEQPTTTYESYNRAQICEQARPLSMPYNIAACDSSDYSFSGGRLDHTTYFVAVDIERDDCESLVIDPLFAAWFAEAAAAYGWSADGAAVPTHSWDWPAQPQIDQQKTSVARRNNLGTGATSLSRVYAEDGADFEDELIVLAKDYGVGVAEMRQILLEANLRNQSKQSADNQSADNPPPVDEQIRRRPARAAAHRNGRSLTPTF